jgi:hypothetical protein
MAELDLRWTDLGERRNGDGLGEAVATYDYVSADGEPLYQVVRFAPKAFRQRHHTGDGWAWGRGIAPAVLYRLPAVLAAVAAGEPVWIVEGEKDAERLAAAGVCATTHAGGAGKFPPGAAGVLHGADVIIVADRDPPGRAHAAEVAGIVTLAGAAFVRIVEAAEGKDAADHLAAGHGVEDFRPAELGQGDPGADHPLAPFLVDWSDFWSHETTTEWLLEPLFAAGRAHALYAGAKTGKSYLLLAACAALATGRPFLGHPGGDPVDVLYVDYEMTAEDIRDRLEEFGYGPDDDLSHLHYALLPLLPPLDTPEGGEALTASAVAVGARFVVIDTTARSISGEENASDTMRAFARCTGLPLKQAGIGYSRADHAGKDATKGQRGTSAKNDDVDVVLRVERTDDGVAVVATHKRMSWYPERTAITIGESDGVVTFSSDSAGWPAGTAETAALLDDLGVPLDASGNVAQKALKGVGEGRRRTLVLAAQRWRNDPVRLVPDIGNHPRNHPPAGDGGTHHGNHPPKPSNTKAEPPPEPPGTTHPGEGVTGTASLDAEPVPAPSVGATEDPIDLDAFEF